MAKMLVKAAIAGACMVTAAPALAEAGEAAASTTLSSPSHPLIIDRSAKAMRRTAHPLILTRPENPNVFGTVALNAGVTFYDARFRRVSSTDARDPLVQRLAAGAAGLDPLSKLRMIQAAVSQSVNWAHDLDNMGVADFWANAGETLKRGTGDSEDIAIVKMQVLKAAGFNPKDLYISVGRDSKRGAHILLLAKTSSGFFALDDDAKDVIPASQHRRFTPIMTLGQGMSWIHGRRVGKVASASPVTKQAR